MLLNHFLIVPALRLTEEINDENFLKKRIEKCTLAFNKKPTFIFVDFYHTKNLITQIEKLNLNKHL